MKFSITVERNNQEIDLTVEGHYLKPIRGSRNGKWGPPLEPDEPASFEIDSVKDNHNHEIELTDKEFNQATEEGLQKYREPDYDYPED